MVFSSVFILCYAIIRWYLQKNIIEQRLRIFSHNRSDEHHTDIEPTEERIFLLKRLLQQITQRLRLKPSRTLIIELMRADVQLSAGEFIVLNLLLAAGPLALIFIGYSLPLVLLLSIAGLVMPTLYIKMRQKKRLSKIGAQLPESLITIANSLKAGYSFMQAIELVSRESEPPIAYEFSLVIKEINLGSTTEAALLNMVERVNSEDLDLVVTAVLIQRQVGGNLSEILESIAHTIRERIRIKGEIKTLTAQGRISGLIIGLLPVALGVFLLLINPDYIGPLFVEPLGRIMLAVCIIGQILAAIIIKKIVNIRV